MSKVNRYWVPNNVLADQSGWHPDDNEVVLAGEHDVALKAAQSELAALQPEVERLQRAEKNDLIAYKAVIEKQDELREELASMKSQPEWVQIQILQNGIAERDAELTAAEQRNATRDIESAAKVLANCMDYPWEHMPENGRVLMRKHAKDIVDAALQPTESGASE